MTPQHPLPAAVLWDMDGTLIDSEPYWIAAETELAARFGVLWTHEDGLSLVGNPLKVSGQVLRDRGVDLEVDAIVEHLLARVTEQVRIRTPWQPDARRLLDDVVAAGIPCALVTMSYARLANAFLAQAPEAFAVVVTGDRVAQGKPHPESYLTAAHELGVPIERCIAIEDSPAGIGSAYASRARTIGVRRLTPIEARPGLSRVATLDGIDLDSLREIAAGSPVDALGETT